MIFTWTPCSHDSGSLIRTEYPLTRSFVKTRNPCPWKAGTSHSARDAGLLWSTKLKSSLRANELPAAISSDSSPEKPRISSDKRVEERRRGEKHVDMATFSRKNTTGQLRWHKLDWRSAEVPRWQKSRGSFDYKIRGKSERMISKRRVLYLISISLSCQV